MCGVVQDLCLALEWRVRYLNNSKNFVGRTTTFLTDVAKIGGEVEGLRYALDLISLESMLPDED